MQIFDCKSKLSYVSCEPNLGYRFPLPVCWDTIRRYELRGGGNSVAFKADKKNSEPFVSSTQQQHTSILCQLQVSNYYKRDSASEKVLFVLLQHFRMLHT